MFCVSYHFSKSNSAKLSPISFNKKKHILFMNVLLKKERNEEIMTSHCLTVITKFVVRFLNV